MFKEFVCVLFKKYHPIYSYRVDVPFRTSHIKHLNASALFLNVHTLQSQYPSSEGLGCRFGLQTKTKINLNGLKKIKRQLEQERRDCIGPFPTQNQSLWTAEVPV